MKTKKKIMLGIGRSRGVTYLLRDDFTTDRAAGAINGTSAEPTGGARTVIDTLSKVSISGGRITFAPNGVASTDGIRWPLVPYEAGRMLKADHQFTVHAAYVGFDNQATGQPAESFVLTNPNALAQVNNASLPIIGTVVAGTTYQLVMISRSASTSGYYYLIKGGEFTNWTLGYASEISITSNYPTIARGQAIADFWVDNFKVLNPRWFPIPIAYDTFDRANGSAGSTLSSGPEGQSITPLEWSGGSISGNQLVVTPSYGSDLITNGSFASDTAWTKGTGWTIGAGVASKAAGVDSYLTQAIGVVNKYYSLVYDVPAISAGSFLAIFGSAGWLGKPVTAPATGIENSRWCTSSAAIGIRATASTVGTNDNVVVREIDPSSIFNVLHTSTADVFAEVAFASTNGTSAGLVLNLDDENNPQNYVIAWHDGVNIHLDKCVGGVLTSLINVTQAYSANAYIRVAKSGTKYRLWYTNTLIGTEQTITDAGVISNTRHGIFSTYVSNTFNNFALYARGTSGEYAALDAF